MSDEGVTLTKACMKNDHSTVTSLIKSQNIKYIINKPVADKLLFDTSDDTLCSTPLTIACERASLDIVQQLVQADADVTGANDTRHKPLHSACYSTIDRLAKVKYILSADSSLVHARNKHNDTPLGTVALCGHEDVLDVLVEHGADVNATGQYECSPLHCAAQKGHVNVIDRLVELKANVNARDHNGFLPLHIAAQFGRVECVTAFIETYKCDINDKNTLRNTPLHLAAWLGHLNVVKYLTSQRGCDMSITNNKGKTALDIAHDEKHQHIEMFFAVRLAMQSDVSTSKRHVDEKQSHNQALAAAQAMEGLDVTDGNTQSAQFLASCVRHHMETLTNDLDIGDHQMYLFSQKVLTKNEHEIIEDVKGATQKMKQLLNTLILKRDVSWAPIFLESLKRNECSKSCATLIETTSADDIRDEEIL